MTIITRQIGIVIWLHDMLRCPSDIGWKIDKFELATNFSYPNFSKANDWLIVIGDHIVSQSKEEEEGLMMFDFEIWQF